MSGLRDRLQQFRKAIVRSQPTARPQAAQPLREPAPEAAPGLPETRLERNERGSFWLREKTLPPDYRHGEAALGELAAGLPGLAALTGGREPEPRSLLFFDTETTGLGVGAGNLPFLIGIGYYGDVGLTIEQLFIRSPAEEPAALAYLREKLEPFRQLVSFNGKAFDWPLLKNRYVLNRLPFLEREPVHLDFLYPSRRMWRTTLPSCRLGTVEEERLGFARENDIPGSLAPTLYFRYLDEKDPQLARSLFAHNEYDLLSLAGLAVLFNRLLQGEWAEEDFATEELFRFASWLDDLGKEALAERAFAEMLRRPEEETRPYWSRLAARYKRKGNRQLAVELWERLANREGGTFAAPLEPYIELAIYYEHRRKNIALALEYAEAALRLNKKKAALSGRPYSRNPLHAELEKRVERLRGKLERQRQWKETRGKAGVSPARRGGSPAGSTKGEQLSLF